MRSKSLALGRRRVVGGCGCRGSATEHAIHHTGKIAWRHDGSTAGILTTAGGLLFTGNADGDLLALDPAKGNTLWHTDAGANLANRPMTYKLDNPQYAIFGVGDDLFAFTLPQH
jgi:alcohol dehydrogenase (cytochrome c)